jgi:site-specific DNA-cytosine methylase
MYIKKHFKLIFQIYQYYEGEEEWPRKKYKGKIDFVYCNPPCAPWSNLGSNSKRRTRLGEDDPRIACWRNSF